MVRRSPIVTCKVTRLKLGYGKDIRYSLVSLPDKSVQHILRNKFRKIVSMNETSDPLTGPSTEDFTLFFLKARYHSRAILTVLKIFWELKSLESELDKFKTKDIISRVTQRASSSIKLGELTPHEVALQ